MPSFEIPADIFTRLSVFDSPKGSSNTFKLRLVKNISLYFKRKHLIIYNNKFWDEIYSEICQIFEPFYRFQFTFMYREKSIFYFKERNFGAQNKLVSENGQ